VVTAAAVAVIEMTAAVAAALVVVAETLAGRMVVTVPGQEEGKAEQSAVEAVAVARGEEEMTEAMTTSLWMTTETNAVADDGQEVASKERRGIAP